jgi:enoyl-CoA hydratase
VSELELITYAVPEGGPTAFIRLDRPDKRNAQNWQMLYELDEAYTRAAFDDAVKVIVLAANGPHFSAGHDIADPELQDVRPRGVWGGIDRPGAEGRMALEQERYLHLCRRWHDLPKPTIAAVQGKVIGGGLMLAATCDLIVAAEEAEFIDPTVGMGVNGVEWFSQPWEVGPRVAKEMLFTGDPLTADDALRLGMVNRVVPRERLDESARELAAKIARNDGFALKLAKTAVNHALDSMGFWTAQQAIFALHQLGHARTREQIFADELGRGLRPDRQEFADYRSRVGGR